MEFDTFKCSYATLGACVVPGNTIEGSWGYWASGFLIRIFTLSQTGSQLHVHCATLSNDGPILQYN